MELDRGFNHRRRICTEEKAKVIAASLRTEMFQFLAALAIYTMMSSSPQEVATTLASSSV